jgi:acyl carrier protein phosphodiesterase
MNFLAHAYLSFNDEGLLTGNLISDFVKGKAQYQYPEHIQKGIRLHRAIDAFTDVHDATKEAATFFKTPYRLYSGAIVDVVYDYFLANDTTIFEGDALLLFSHQVYNVLEKQAAHLPPTFARLFTYMKAENWLWNYRTPQGIGRSLHGLARRATYLTEGDTAFALFQQHHDALQGCYTRFIADVKTFTKQQIAAQER